MPINPSSGSGTTAPLFCLACHGKYFAASLPIHQKTCFQKNAFVDIQCPTCHTKFRTGKYHSHVATCKGVPQVVEVPSIKNTIAADSLSIGTCESDGRIRCKKCQRGFTEDRIAKHQAVCQASPPKKQQLEATKDNQIVVYQQATVQNHSVKHKSSPKRTPLKARVSYNPPIPTKSIGGGAICGQMCTNINMINSNRGKGRALDISMSNATSSCNPLATNRLMTLA